MNYEFLKGKTTLVTGGSGLLGMSLTKHLISKALFSLRENDEYFL